MIAVYERRAARLAALAAYAEDPQDRRRYLEEKHDCEQMIKILRRLKNDSRKI